MVGINSNQSQLSVSICGHIGLDFVKMPSIPFQYPRRFSLLSNVFPTGLSGITDLTLNEMKPQDHSATSNGRPAIISFQYNKCIMLISRINWSVCDQL